MLVANADVPIHSSEVMYRTVILTSLMIAASASVSTAQSFVLSGWAEIPSTYRHPGPKSGQFTTAANGVTPPYVGQVLPGFSGIIPGNSPGSFFGLPDNGFGRQDNSADFVLGFYSFTPTFKTTGDSTIVPGSVTVNSFTTFSDPNEFLNNSHITAGPVYSRTNYYSTSSIPVPVDSRIRDNKLLTGADFDVESFVRLDDGSFWVGEEFGPYLLHFDGLGQLLEAPIAHPTLRAPQNPQNTAANPSNLPSSSGFESLARNGDGSKLYLTTEASIDSELDKRLLQIYEFDTRTKSYTGKAFSYAKESTDVSNKINSFVTGDMTHVGNDRYVIIERGQLQKLYLIDLSKTDADAPLKKTPLVDLLNILDPNDIGGPLPGIATDRFNFPLGSVEAVTLVDPFTLLVSLDNNYPWGSSRISGRPDNTEMITIRFDQPLAIASVPTPSMLFGLIGMGVKVALRRRKTG
jgi:hypothetical protein